MGIPYLYVATGVLLSEGLSEQGKSKEAATVLDEAKKIATATQRQEFFAPDQGAPPAPPAVPSGDSSKKTTVPVKKPDAGSRKP